MENHYDWSDINQFRRMLLGANWLKGRERGDSIIAPLGEFV